MSIPGHTPPVAPSPGACHTSFCGAAGGVQFTDALRTTLRVFTDSTPEGHHVWRGYHHRGVASLKIEGVYIAVHRLRWFAVHGSLPKRLRNTCGLRSCVNVEHYAS